MLLFELELGQLAEIVCFVGETAVTQRMEEMGLIPGEEVKIVRYAPLGDPMEIEIKGYHLSLRRDEAAQIKVKRK